MSVRDGKHSDRDARIVTALLSQIHSDDEFEESGRHVQASVWPADGWLIVLATVMSDGIIQGMTWDTCKLVLARCLAQLQSEGVAPQAVGDRTTSRDMLVRWSGYLEMGNLFKLFSKIEMHYKSSSQSTTARVESKKPAKKTAKKLPKKKAAKARPKRKKG